MMLTGEQYRIKTDRAFVNVLTIGDLSSLHWIESPLKYFTSADHPDQQLCRVHYAALNFRDVMLATGKLPPDAIPGACIPVDQGLCLIIRIGVARGRPGGLAPPPKGGGKFFTAVLAVQRDKYVRGCLTFSNCECD